jgi:hypothetical protein
MDIPQDNPCGIIHDEMRRKDMWKVKIPSSIKQKRTPLEEAQLELSRINKTIEMLEKRKNEVLETIAQLTVASTQQGGFT